ncbi:deoxyribose-phosphate aldolase [Candidatus Fermentibacterales bacterium]|nr:deoxyribose-phosphate aldolase [Candidatus Fermentibacterales bacterium]
MIDHTLLRADATSSDIERLCGEAIEHSFCSVCVNPCMVELASSLLEGSGVLVCSVVGFPLGAGLCKAVEASMAVRLGAGEIDMVASISGILEGRTDEVRREVEDVVGASGGKPVKLIIETCLLSREQKLLGCDVAMEAGAAFVKTSTGFGAGGATVEDVRLLRERCAGRIGVKASGGIRTLDDALAMVEAGATRLGCSGSVQIMREARERDGRIDVAGR